jgi:hypothetical protein
MARAAAHGGLPRGTAKNGRRIEGHVSQIDQIGLAASDHFRSKYFARASKRILVKLGAGRQHGFVAAERKRVRIRQRQGQQQAECKGTELQADVHS